MTSWSMRIVGALFGLIAGVASGVAAGDAPRPADVLFNAPHLGLVDAGSTLSYRLEQKVSETDVLGEPIADDIKIVVDKVLDSGKRDISVSVFTEDRARPMQKLPGMTGNPLLLIFLDRSVKIYRGLAGGKVSYLKNRFKTELASHAKVEATKVTYGGKEVDGFRVSVAPFENDPNRHKMRGYHGSTYSFLVSSSVPGYIVEMVGKLESPKDGAPALEERVKFVGVGGAK